MPRKDSTDSSFYIEKFISSRRFKSVTSVMWDKVSTIFFKLYNLKLTISLGSVFGCYIKDLGHLLFSVYLSDLIFPATTVLR